MSGLTQVPVASNPAARTYFLSTIVITTGVMLAANYLRAPAGLSAIFYSLFVIADYWGAVSLLLILTAALVVPSIRPVNVVLRWIGEHPEQIAFTTLVALSAGTLVVYQNHPLAMDEYAQYFQSRVFARGHLAGHFPVPLLDWLIPEGFQNAFLGVSRQTGAVASMYWPSFALLLAPFAALGIPWACNPLISAATLLVIHRLALRIFNDTETAGLAILLTVASPVFFANGISYYSMPAHLFANALYALLLIDPTPRRAFAAGLLGSIALTLHNPVPHLLFALPWIGWLALRPGGMRSLVALAAGYLPLSLLLGVGWFWFIGHLQNSAPGHSQIEHVQGLGSAFSLPGASTWEARLMGLAKVWVWAVPGLPLLAAIGAWKLRHNIACRLLVAAALLTFIGYLFVPMDQGHGWGFRYFHSVWFALPLLGAAAARTSETRSLVLACAALTLVFGVGFRAWQMASFIADQRAQAPAYTGQQRRVIILDPTATFYGPDLVQNDPWLRDNAVIMITRGRTNDEAMMHTYFPEMHRVYVDKFGTVWSRTTASSETQQRAERQ